MNKLLAMWVLTFLPLLEAGTITIVGGGKGGGHSGPPGKIEIFKLEHSTVGTPSIRIDICDECGGHGVIGEEAIPVPFLYTENFEVRGGEGKNPGQLKIYFGGIGGVGPVKRGVGIPGPSGSHLGNGGVVNPRALVHLWS